MKLPTKKDIAVAALCIVVPGAIIGAIAYYFLKDKLNVKKTTVKKSKNKKTNKSTVGKHR